MVALQAQVLDQLPTDLAIEVLRCAPGTISSQLRRLPQSLSSLVALAMFPALAAACTLPSDRPGAASDLPTLTLCVDVGQARQAMLTWQPALLQTPVATIQTSSMALMARRAASGCTVMMNLRLLMYSVCTPCSCLLYTSPSPRDRTRSRMPSSA